MLEKFCLNLTNKLRSKVPSISDEKADEINFAFLVLFGEGPKIVIIFLIAWLFKIIDLTLITFIAMSVYRLPAGGVHLNGHFSCLFSSTLVFCGIGLIAKSMVTTNMYLLYTLYGLIFIFDILIITKYAPADTENIPVISPQYRERKKRNSYIAVFLIYIFALLISPTQLVANICILSTFIQSITMTEFIYKLSKCEYGEVTRMNLDMIKNT